MLKKRGRDAARAVAGSGKLGRAGRGPISKSDAERAGEAEASPGVARVVLDWTSADRRAVCVCARAQDVGANYAGLIGEEHALSGSAYGDRSGGKRVRICGAGHGGGCRI